MDLRKHNYMGTTLKRLRMSHQLSQEDLAWRSSLDRKTISLLETNQQEPMLGTIMALCSAFEMLPSEFMKEFETDIFRNKNRTE